MTGSDRRPELPQEVRAYVQPIIEAASQRQLRDLIARPPADVLHRQPDRRGITTIVVRTTSLSDEQLRTLLTYRLGQYLADDLTNPTPVYQRQMVQEPWSTVGARDCHVIAIDSATGRILCYLS